MTQTNKDDIAAALSHMGFDSVADLHYWAKDANELNRFDALVQLLARHRTQSAAHNVPVLLEAHFKRMQEACANYLEPTTYIARHPVGELCKWNTEFPEPSKHQSIDGALATTRRRDQAFINDMIYMLDGPEQRAAIAQAQEPEA